jgi:hypothetical protein
MSTGDIHDSQDAWSRIVWGISGCILSVFSPILVFRNKDEIAGIDEN